MFRCLHEIQVGLEYPKAIAVDSDGNLYVGCCGYNGGLQRFAKDASPFGYKSDFTLTIGKIMGVAVNHNGLVYVTRKADTHEVRAYTSDGAMWKAWGRCGAEIGEFCTPTGIACDDDGNVYVIEASSWPSVPYMDTWVAGGNRLQKFDGEGAYQNGWGTYGFDEGCFNVPVGIAVGRNNHIYVADTYNSRIQAFNANGRFLLQWGQLGEGKKQFNNPQGVAADINGDIYVADTYNNRVQHFNADGEFISAFGTEDDFWLPCGIAVDEYNNLFVADTMRHRILIYANASE